MQYIDFIITHYGWQGCALAATILVLLCVQLWYYLVTYGRISRFRNSRRKKKLTSEPPVSVIVPMFSEDYIYLDEHLPLLLSQQYATTFEVVIVYVGANSDFYEELSRLRLFHQNLTVTKIEFTPRFPISVKMALNVGSLDTHIKSHLYRDGEAGVVLDFGDGQVGVAQAHTGHLLVEVVARADIDQYHLESGSVLLAQNQRQRVLQVAVIL